MTISVSLRLICVIFLLFFFTKSSGEDIISANNIKHFKKILRTRINVLVLFQRNSKSGTDWLQLFKGISDSVRGTATLVKINCGENKKLCKRLKVSPSPILLQHYLDGYFHKIYDRQKTERSMIHFLFNPREEIPWVEDETAKNVHHLENMKDLAQMTSDKRPILLMFYAPWCHHCRQLKPEFAKAADEIGNSVVLAGMNVDKPENAHIKQQFNITHYPTLLYIKDGRIQFEYKGNAKSSDIVAFMKNPKPAAPEPKEAEWADEPSNVVHLSSNNFDKILAQHSSALVMFYAPWCGHCKVLKPEYVKAADAMKKENIPGVLAAIDATKHNALSTKYKITGFPTVKYFISGEFKFNVNDRTQDKIIAFMKDPKEPPPPPPEPKPWSEVVSDVQHLDDETFKSFLKTKKHVMVMFYAPWCGHCQAAKPEFMKAATSLKDNYKMALAAVDCTVYQSVCHSAGVEGYPTLLHYTYGKRPLRYNGQRKATDFVNFMYEPSKHDEL